MPAAANRDLCVLRARIQALEAGRHRGRTMPLGLAAIDAALPGGGLSAFFNSCGASSREPAIIVAHDLTPSETANLDPKIEAAALASLGLRPETVPTQIVARDRHAALFQALARLGTAVERKVPARAMNTTSSPTIAVARHSTFKSSATSSISGRARSAARS